MISGDGQVLYPRAILDIKFRSQSEGVLDPSPPSTPPSFIITLGSFSSPSYSRYPSLSPASPPPPPPLPPSLPPPEPPSLRLHYASIVVISTAPNSTQPAQPLVLDTSKLEQSRLTLSSTPPKVSETRAHLKEANGPAKAHYCPVQNLFYSECRLALNDLSNHMEVERVRCEEFIYRENMVERVDGLAHFVVERHVKSSFELCRRTKASSSPSSITKLPQIWL
ncbi:hypothetical protein SAY87_030226 [Trapa incisa]|uniref:Uncharacterized protein n=1 Tax=Trapa incisa TaxID=236973 RepID=A0AAN7KRG9_9MYRT|nr:hypothetical protein SAY87_030226 [Trapa incisa]